jgi:hypothetical protein
MSSIDQCHQLFFLTPPPSIRSLDRSVDRPSTRALHFLPIYKYYTFKTLFPPFFSYRITSSSGVLDSHFIIFFSFLQDPYHSRARAVEGRTRGYQRQKSFTPRLARLSFRRQLATSTVLWTFPVRVCIIPLSIQFWTLFFPLCMYSYRITSYTAKISTKRAAWAEIHSSFRGPGLKGSFS